MANFTEIFNEIKTAAAGTKTTFSRTDFDRLAKAYVNETGYTAKVYGKDGVAEVETVKALRGMIKRILKDFGVDEQEAAKIMTDEYQIRNVDGIYELCSELVYNYLDAGKKFSFLAKEDFEGSLVLESVEESESITKGVGEGAPEFLVKKKAHKKIKAKSGCPKWLKTSTQR